MNREYQIDGRTGQAIGAQIEGLAASYTPEWVFDRKNPDVGSVIALIFAGQMAQNIKRLDRVGEKYRTEFVNMLGLSPLPAYPAQGVAVVELVRGAVPGIDLPKGTKLLGQSDEQALPIVFETCSDVHITDARLCDILAISPGRGKIIPLMGGAKKAAIVHGPAQSGEGEAADETADAGFLPFALFDFEGEGIAQNCLMLYHKTVFDTAADIGISIRLRGARGGEDLSSLFADPARYTWKYLSHSGLVGFDAVYAEEGAVVLRRSGEIAQTEIGGEPYAMIVVEARDPVRTAVELGEIGVASSCEKAAADFVCHNADELDRDGFMPFGETASLFDECYIGHDAVLSQQGAEVTVRFDLSYREKLVKLTLEQENESLKVIKRKPRTVVFETANTAAQRIALEYFNGLGWRKLELTRDCSTLLDGTHAGKTELTFTCPDDWQPLTIGGSHGRCLRVRLTQADNCYLQPCLHKMPVITGLSLSYHYPGEWKMPQRLRRICGTQEGDLTGAMLEKRPVVAFEPLPYTEDGLYLGFDKKMTGAPISILFNVEQNVFFSGAAIEYAYSTAGGFKRLKVIDHTQGFCGVGTLLFIPPPDFAQMTVEGVRRHWIRLCDGSGELADGGRYRPVVRSIVPNAVEIQNEETLPEEGFYIDVMTPNMSFPIAAQNILTCEVFVNEMGSLTPAVMRQMALEQPENVRVSYNFLGDISEFFVRWTEVDSFDNSTPADRHYRIDRMTNTIHFGDGVSVMAPRAQTSEAFTVRARCCRGAAGNLPPDAVNATQMRVLHIESITNPVATWSGCDIESVEKAHERGANIISSRGRLVSTDDFLREVKAFSAAIEKVRCVAGRDIDGTRDDRLISIAIMMADYKSGAYSFAGMSDRLKRHLLEKCACTVSADKLKITEPVYVSISVAVFAQTAGVDKSFDIQSTIARGLEDYLEPLSRTGRWQIGRLPTEAQIGLLLGSLHVPAAIKGFTVTARYTDANGSHECGLDGLSATPFMIGVNGTHTVHLALE